MTDPKALEYGQIPSLSVSTQKTSLLLPVRSVATHLWMDGTIKAVLSNVVRRDEATKEEGEGERASGHPTRTKGIILLLADPD